MKMQMVNQPSNRLRPLFLSDDHEKKMVHYCTFKAETLSREKEEKTFQVRS
jgi:hypothetical protein